MPFCVCEEVVVICGVREDHGLSEKGPDLCPAYVKHAAEPGYVLQRHVGTLGDKAVPQPGSVKIERDAAAAADSAERFELAQRVDRTVLGRVRYIDHARLDHVAAAGIAEERVEILSEVFRRDLPVFFGYRDDLVAVGFHGPRLTLVYMAGSCRDNALIAFEQGVGNCGVRLRASGQEIDSGVRTAAGRADPVRGAFAVIVRAVARVLLEIDLGEPSQDLGVSAFHVVAVKAKQSDHPLHL